MREKTRWKKLQEIKEGGGQGEERGARGDTGQGGGERRRHFPLSCRSNIRIKLKPEKRTQCGRLAVLYTLTVTDDLRCCNCLRTVAC